MNTMTAEVLADVLNDDFDADIAAPYTPEQREQLERDTDTFLKSARKSGDVMTGREFMITRAANAGTEDVVSFIMDTAGDVEEASKMAVKAGFGAHTWNDGAAITRRAKDAARAAKRGAKMTQLQNVEKRGSVEPAKPAKPVATSDAQRVAMDYYAELMSEYPARREKLARSLAWQISEYDSTVNRYCDKGFSAQDAQGFWLKGAKAAGLAKVTK